MKRSRYPFIAFFALVPILTFYIWSEANEQLGIADLLKGNEVQWKILKTEPFQGKQDDIFFVSPNTGWYVNGKGYIYKTADGGANWSEQVHQPGTFFRAIGMVSEQVGFAGNIGPDYFPGVTDSIPLYKTIDGGKTWTPVKDVTDKMIFGVCSIDILKTLFINSGVLDTRTTIRAAGRVGGPAYVVTSRDGGNTWTSQDMSSYAAMILDIKFLDDNTGFICAASDADVTKSHARILKTADGGKNWKIVYESTRPYELTWKCSFPSSKVGYATIQSYDPDPAMSQRSVAKTVDGGETWSEVPLVNDASVREFGIGFYDELIGWVGAADGLWMTLDGGESWTHQKVGRAINKIRVVHKEQGGPVVYGIGAEVLRLDLQKPAF